MAAHRHVPPPWLAFPAVLFSPASNELRQEGVACRHFTLSPHVPPPVRRLPNQPVGFSTAAATCKITCPSLSQVEINNVSGSRLMCFELASVLYCMLFVRKKKHHSVAPLYSHEWTQPTKTNRVMSISLRSRIPPVKLSSHISIFKAFQLHISESVSPV